MKIDRSPLDTRRYPRWLVAISASTAAIALMGCGADSGELDDPTATLPAVSVEGFEDAAAELDFDTGTANSPISRYLVNLDFETEVLFSQARETLITECMAESGFVYEGLTGVDWGALKLHEDRVFGLWDREAAATFGAGFDPSRGTPKVTFVEEGPDFNSALNWCADGAMQNETLGSLAVKLSEQTLADRILGNATNLALQSSEGKAANALFADCLAEKSIVVDPSNGYPSADYAELGKGAEIEAVLAEVDCNIGSGRIETLYNLRAQYEAAYIAKYETQLADVLAGKEADQAALRAIIESAR